MEQAVVAPAEGGAAQASSEIATSVEDVEVAVAAEAKAGADTVEATEAAEVEVEAEANAGDAPAVEESKDTVSELKTTAVGVRRLSLRMDKKLNVNTKSNGIRVSRRNQICHNPASPEDFCKVGRLGEGSVGRV